MIAGRSAPAVALLGLLGLLGLCACGDDSVGPGVTTPAGTPPGADRPSTDAGNPQSSDAGNPERTPDSPDTPDTPNTPNTPDTPGSVPTAQVAYRTCAPELHVGSLTVKPETADADPARHFTSIGGQVVSAVDPADVHDVAMVAGDCELLRPPDLFCDPACAGGETCGADGRCAPFPVGIDVGALTLTGLSAPVEISARPPAYRYFDNSLPHPAFAAGDTVQLSAAGGAGEPFAIAARAVAALQSDATHVPLESGSASVVTWAAASDPASAEPDADTRVEIELNIANHGGTPGRILCETADTGELELPVELTDTLLDLGYSGFPSLRVTRQGVGSADIEAGCVELRVISELILNVDIPGLASCSSDADCEAPETCQPDLSCG